MAIFILEVKNIYHKEPDISIAANLGNPFAKGSLNKYLDKDSFKGIKLFSNHYQEDDPDYGDITLTKKCVTS